MHSLSNGFSGRRQRFPVLLVLILLLSILLNFLFLYKEGYGNLYYAAAVKSMLTGFKNFFFVSFDSAGFVSVDKPPLGLWIQALFALIFGFKGISLILPQAVAGVLSVILLYALVKDIHDERAGLISAFVLAITPVFVALSRNNTMDMQVVCIIILASRTFFRAIQKKSFPYLIITFALIGLGFNIKMLLSFIILPAICTVWLLSRHIQFKKRFMQIAAAGIVLLVISFSWIFIVEFYPKEGRPYVGSTENNSAFELAFSYYGLTRITKQPDTLVPGAPHLNPDEAGRPGIPRLFNKQLSGQISWFLPLVFMGLLFSLIKPRDKSGTDIEKLSILYWFLWLSPYALYLSFSTGIVHLHYVAALAPPIAALCGIYLIRLWDSYNGKEKSGFLFAVAVFLTGLLHFIIVNEYCRVPKIFLRVPRYFAAIILIIVTIFSLLSILRKSSVKLNKGIPGIVLYIPIIIALSASPFYWACTPLIYGGDCILPYASPDLYTDSVKGFRFVEDDHADRILPSYVNPMYEFLTKNRNKEEFLAAVPSPYAGAALLMLYNENNNIPVMTIGGFTGTDPILDLEELKRYVRDGKVRFFLVPSYLEHPEEMPFLVESGGNEQLYQWVIDHGKKLDKKLWDNNGLIVFPIPDPMSLYDLKK
jgi:4-amino-4-deoxy-L-arabinose transferase-like glycosyltransferase